MRTTSLLESHASEQLHSEHDDRGLLWVIGLVLALVASAVAFLGYHSDRASRPTPPAIERTGPAPPSVAPDTEGVSQPATDPFNPSATDRADPGT